MSEEHEQQLAEAFVALADTLVDDFDVLDFLHTLAEHAAELLTVSAAGVVLSDQHGGLATTAAYPPEVGAANLVVTQTDDGPCHDCLQHGTTVTSADLGAEHERWPHFAPTATQHGYRAASAVPMRLRGRIIGALTLLNQHPQAVDENSTRLGQALADVATISILQQRAVDRTEMLSEQLQATLNHNVTLAQARGVLAEHGDLTLTQAHTRLRHHARHHQQRLSELAREIADGTASPHELLTTTPSQSTSPTRTRG
ncbi:hypothetical protein GCM10027174_07390 [Salinifilum aidingensis]